MQSLGVNTITFELRAADPRDGPFVAPRCAIGPALGVTFPSPDPADLSALSALLDLLHARGMKMWLQWIGQTKGLSRLPGRAGG